MRILLFIFAAVAALNSSSLKDTTMDKPRLKKFFLPEVDQYIDWWKISDQNFDQRVLESVDPWIIVIAPEHQIPVAWKEYATRYRGQFWFGKFFDKWGKNLGERFGYEGKPKVLVYSWTREAKKKGPFITDNFSVALEKAIESLPVTSLQRLSFDTTLEDPSNIDAFLTNALYGEEKNPKWPVIFLLGKEDEEEGLPPITRVISHYFSDSFKFAFVKFDQLKALKKVFPDYYPTDMKDEFPDTFIVAGKEPSDDAPEDEFELTFSVVRMSKQKFGMSTKFNDVAAFFFWVNEQIRETLPGRDPNEDMDKKTMGSIRNKLWKRLEIIKPAVMKAQKESDVMQAAKRFENLNAAASKLLEEKEKEAERLKNELEETQAKLEEAEGKIAESEDSNSTEDPADAKADVEQKDEL